jgi:phosphopantetheinyl transferase
VAAVYVARTDGLDFVALYSRWHASLDGEELTRIETLRLERDKRDYLRAHVLLRLALAESRDLDPNAIEPAESHGWSLSHSHGFVACVIADDPRTAVGIDTEPVAAAERLAEITDTFLTQPEFYGLPIEPEARALRMVETWTAKEAVLKALGEGFSGELGFGVLSRLESTPLGTLDEWATISVRDARTGAAYSVWQRWVGDHAIATVATEGNEGTPRLRFLKLEGD